MNLAELTRIYLFLFLLVLSLPSCSTDVFTAVDKLKVLFDLETQLIPEIKTYIDKEAKSGTDLEKEWKQVFANLEVENLRDQGDPRLVENPINFYHLLRRTLTELQPLLEFIICEECEEWQTTNAQDLKKQFKAANKSGNWPSESDVAGAAISLVRLSDVYALNMSELLDGKIRNTQTQPITDEEIFQIVQSVDGLDLSYQCIRWLMAGIGRALKRPDQRGAIRFYKRAAGVYLKEDMIWKALETMQEAITIFPEDKGLNRDLQYYTQKMDTLSHSKRRKTIERMHVTKLTKTYEGLCRSRKRPYKDGSCRYRTTRIPIYVAKEEILTLDPRIAMYHDVIYDSEMDHIKEFALKKLFRSVVALEGAPTSDKRISQSAWIRDYEDPVVLRMTKRIELITGLSLKEKKQSGDSEALQVLNYGIGGMYESHYDFFNTSYHAIREREMEELANSGDRLATWLFYLNDVKEGGATVFPNANVRVPVIKGSAAFWYNLKRSSVGDDRTLHAGCPVLIGSKWVSNKWIRLNGNLFNARCGLKEESIYNL